MAEDCVTEETRTEPSERIAYLQSRVVLGLSATFEQLQPAYVESADWPTCWTLDKRNEFCAKYESIYP